MDTESNNTPAELAPRWDDLVAEMGTEIDELLRELSRLHREPLDLRARQRLKRAEQAAKRIAAIVRQVAADKSEGSSGGPVTADDVGGQGG